MNSKSLFWLLTTLLLTTPPVASAQLTKLTIGNNTLSTNGLPAWMAKEAGIFRTNGLDVQIVYFRGGTITAMALIARETPISQVSGPPIVSAALKGADAVMVAAGNVVAEYWLMSKPELKTGAQLKGGAVAIATFGGLSDSIARIALQRLGLNAAKDVTLVQIGTIPERLSALESGKVQAAMLNAPDNFRAQKRGLYKLVEVRIPYQGIGVGTTRAFIRENPDVVRRYVKSQIEAVHRIKTDREGGIRVLAKYLGIQDREVLEKAYDDAISDEKLPQKQYPSLEGIKKILEPLAESDPKAKAAKPEDFADMRFVKELDESGFVDELYKGGSGSGPMNFGFSMVRRSSPQVLDFGLRELDMTKIFQTAIRRLRFDNPKAAPQTKIQNPKWVGLSATAFVLVVAGPVAPAQQPTKIPRIGYLSAGGRSFSAGSVRIETFRQGLRELGYVEGKNINIEYRTAEGKLDRLPALAAELVRLKVEIIVTGGPPSARAAKEATVTIPIVMTGVGDPVGSGFVASLARPGGNITGLSTLAPELSGKRLELLKEVLPRLSRVAVFGTFTSPDNAQSLREVELAAKAFGVKLQYLDVRDASNPKDIETAFRAASKAQAEAVLMMVAPVVASRYPKEIAELAVKSRLPVIFSGGASVEAGGLMSYGINNIDLNRRAATYVDKILKGAKPADLPVEQPMKFEFVINLKAAKQIGLTIPPNVLVRADKVIR